MCSEVGVERVVARQWDVATKECGLISCGACLECINIDLIYRVVGVL